MTSPSRVKRNYDVLDKGSIAKKRKRRLSASEEEDSRGTFSSSKYSSEPPLSKVYNSSFRNNKPAELFRKDLISAMKLADNEQLYPEDYWIISDSWKQEWERGVQVPVNPETLPIPVVKYKNRPKKYIKCTYEKFSNDWHVMSDAVTESEKVCRYDLDDLDVEWLKIFNEEQESRGFSPVDEITVELIIEKLEIESFENLHNAKKREGIEYDEDVICDVCRSPDTEEGNEMVFCDSCNICVHQACYGITSIPEGSWVCCTCAFGLQPPCLLCPNKGGAMKSTRSGQKWAHVSCALWIPEVTIGCVEKMEPITKISTIPASRWSLVCSLCKEKTGACIQCSIKTCKIAYHVTCAFTNGLEMKAIIAESEEDGIKLKSFCRKHSKQKDTSDTETEFIPKKRTRRIKRELNMSNGTGRKKKEKVNHVPSEFFSGINITSIAEFLKVDETIVDFVYHYWKLKRKANFNKPLLMPKFEEINVLGADEKDFARMKMFVHCRQDLERVRNLCYMVGRREKLFRSWYRIKEEIFYKQLIIMTESPSLTEEEKMVVLHANHSDSVYDKFYTSNNDTVPSLSTSIYVLEGKLSDDDRVMCKNIEKRRTNRLPNPYAKQYINGTYNRVQRRLPAETSFSKVSSNDKLDCKTRQSTYYCDVSELENENTIGFSDFQTYFAEKSGLLCFSSSKEKDKHTKKGCSTQVDHSEVNKKKVPNNKKSVTLRKMKHVNVRYSTNKLTLKNKRRNNRILKKYSSVRRTALSRRLTRSCSRLYNRKKNKKGNQVRCLKLQRKCVKKQIAQNSCIVEQTNKKLAEQNIIRKKDKSENRTSEKNEISDNIKTDLNENSNQSQNNCNCSKANREFKRSRNIKRIKNFDSNKEKEIRSITRRQKQISKLDESSKETEVSQNTVKNVDKNAETTQITKEIPNEFSSNIQNIQVQEGSDILQEKCNICFETNDICIDKTERRTIPTRSCKLDNRKLNSNVLSNKEGKKNSIVAFGKDNMSHVCRKSRRIPLVCTIDQQVLLENNDKSHSDFQRGRFKPFNVSDFPVNYEDDAAFLFVSGKEKMNDCSLLKEDESNESCHTVEAYAKSQLGYRPPRKLKDIIEEEDTENKESRAIVSLDRSEQNIDNLYKGDLKCSSRNWNYSDSAQSHLNGNIDIQSPRLVIRLRKDPNFPDCPRWQTDSEFDCPPEKDINSSSSKQIYKINRHLRSEKKALYSSNAISSDVGSKENGSRYLMRCRTPLLKKNGLLYLN